MDEKVISYTDMVGTLMSSVTDIVRCDQLRPCGFCGDLPHCVLHNDRRHYLYQRVGAEKGNRHPPGYRRIQAEYFPGI